MSIRRLRALLASRPEPAADLAVALLAERDPDHEIERRRAESAPMRMIYERRSRRTDPVLGVVELARRMVSYDQTELTTTYAEVAGQMVFVFLNLDETEVLGCILGRAGRTEPLST